MPLDEKTKQAAYRARMRAKGLQQIPVWVPREDVALIRDVARRLREGEELRQATREKEKTD